MRATAAHPVATRAGGHLAPLAPPRYAGVRSNLAFFLEGLDVYRLWWEVFGEDVADQEDLWHLKRAFVHRVNEELFPLDMEMVADLMLSEEHAFEYCIPLRGWRVPWEVAHPSDLPPYQQVVAACLHDANSAPREVFGFPGAGDEVDPDDPEWSPYAYLDSCRSDLTRGLFLPWMDQSTPLEVVEAALEKLASFPYPSGGLADLVRAGLDLVDNLFLALPEGIWVVEYADYQWVWDAEDVRVLARLYDAARPVVGRIRAFRRWFDTAFVDRRAAHRAVARMLEATL